MYFYIVSPDHVVDINVNRGLGGYEMRLVAEIMLPSVAMAKPAQLEDTLLSFWFIDLLKFLLPSHMQTIQPGLPGRKGNPGCRDPTLLSRRNPALRTF